MDASFHKDYFRWIIVNDVNNLQHCGLSSALWIIFSTVIIFMMKNCL